LQSICAGWPWTEILLIPASWVTRIIGVSHWYLASCGLFLNLWRNFCFCILFLPCYIEKKFLKYLVSVI
jgi:hypothetical protein